MNAEHVHHSKMNHPRVLLTGTCNDSDQDNSTAFELQDLSLYTIPPRRRDLKHGVVRARHASRIERGLVLPTNSIVPQGAAAAGHNLSMAKTVRFGGQKLEDSAMSWLRNSSSDRSHYTQLNTVMRACFFVFMCQSVLATLVASLARSSLACIEEDTRSEASLSR